MGQYKRDNVVNIKRLFGLFPAMGAAIAVTLAYLSCKSIPKDWKKLGAQIAPALSVIRHTFHRAVFSVPVPICEFLSAIGTDIDRFLLGAKIAFLRAINLASIARQEFFSADFAPFFRGLLISVSVFTFTGAKAAGAFIVVVPFVAELLAAMSTDNNGAVGATHARHNNLLVGSGMLASGDRPSTRAGLFGRATLVPRTVYQISGGIAI